MQKLKQTKPHLILIIKEFSYTYIIELFLSKNSKPKLVNLIVEGEVSSLVGSIYKAQVQAFHRGLGAYFVRLDSQQSAFLCENVQDVAASNLATSEEILVQVTRDSLEMKHPLVTTRIGLPGRFLVYLPTTSNYIGVSRQVGGAEIRDQIKQNAQKWCGEHSIIIRTNGIHAPIEILKLELEQLQTMWSSIQKKFKAQKTPGQIWSDESRSIQFLRDILTEANQTQILVEDSDLFNDLNQFTNNMSDFKNSIHLYSGKPCLLDKYELRKTLSKLLEKKVLLKSGGFIVIEETAAAVVIDVNTGRAKSQKNIAAYLLKTNKEAVQEIAKQVRLRNLAGIILIDFIDMKDEYARKQIMRDLEAVFKKDRAYVEILPISDLGVVEMTRKKSRPSLSQILCQPCKYCQGQGYIKNTR